MRPAWVLIHRYVGLVMAGFLLIAGLTGSFLVWYQELDSAINPRLMRVTPPSADARPLDPLLLRERVQAAHPGAWVHYVPLQQPAGQSASFWIEGATDPATGRLAELPYDEVFVDPYSGNILGARKWGAISHGLVNLMPFLYRLHYSLALGTIGTWAFGIVALLWTLDCFIGAYLTFPARQRPSGIGLAPAKSWWRRWWPAWKIRPGSSAYKLNFDLHRAGGLWPWAMLLVLAWSSVAFNLYREVYRPVMGSVFTMQPDVQQSIPKLPKAEAAPAMGWPAAVDAARWHMDALAHRHGFVVREEDRLSYDPQRGMLRLVSRTSRDINDKHGQTAVFVDARNGNLVGSRIPTGTAAGDTVTTWIQTLHMAQIWGLPFRLFMTFVGMAVGMLSVTGVVIWWIKKKARLHAAQSRKVADNDLRAAAQLRS